MLRKEANMASVYINPTRMELSRLKKRLLVARRGHKLMKDKRDELMKKFLEYAERNKILREQVEAAFRSYYESFILAMATTRREFLEEALFFPRWSPALSFHEKIIMNVAVPEFHIHKKIERRPDIHAYGYSFTSSRLDEAMDKLEELFPLMFELAEVEKTVQLLSDEIEKTRRRVNALEHVLIPQLEQSIRYISMKLEENERGNLVRLMKIKDMIIERKLRESSTNH